MVDKTQRTVVKPQAALTTNDQDKRKLEMIQLETRYKASFRLVSENKDGTIVRLAIKPSDPDFPYEIDALQLQLTIPRDYPKVSCKVQVLNSDIPKGFAINLEKGYIARVESSTAHQTLVRQMNWLDRNMESLLQQAPAPTVRFIAHNKELASTAVTAVSPQQQQPVKHYIDATAEPISNANIRLPPRQYEASASSSSPATASSSKPIPNNKPLQVERLEPVNVPVLDTVSKKQYSAKELSQADKRRKHEYRQLQTRFCDTFRTVRTTSKETIATLTMIINDTDFTHEQLIGGKELHIKYHVPALYPLESCSIEIDNKKLDRTRATWITQGFEEHVAKGDYTLFENLNWLNRNIELLLSTPPTQKTEEQVEADSIAAAQQKDLKPPLKAAQQQLGLSVTAPEFTPQQTKPSDTKKKASLFDEASDIKKNKVIIVNDPSLVIEQADEEEVEVELAEGEDDYHRHLKEAHQQQEGGEKTLVGLSQPVVRRGTEIRLVDPKLENISLFRCALLHIMVKCARCKDTVEVENIKPEQEDKQAASSSSKQPPKTERWMSCPTCSSVLGIKFLGELVHQGALSVGLLQLAGCTPYDILPSAYIGTCGSCMADMASTVRLSPHDPPRTLNCFSCHTKMTCGLGDYKFVKIGSEGGERLIANEEQVMKLKKKKKSREDPLTIGEPLPDQGTCSHYRKSKRWFRFSCCSKLYPCDICHDGHEDHSYDYAKRHVCGLCSREQTIVSGKPCVCGHEFEKAPQKQAFWEGGKGVRNKIVMSRKDPHKHKGSGKTTSKKQDRVGIAGKERHQTESSS
ncbi:uncharacterized protein ATC70_004481 [Mucor velutinosus]|uniref:CHY-type domain-containing protein n=1 Tax=Mucor velutinosus TaxID=708070 RepID=A0AAN7DR88_9FUNG|nr:hypothetical protein ATC70_004481 [Mucor velutinosus]